MRRIFWSGVVGLYAVFAIAAIWVMVRDNVGSDDGTTAPAKSATPVVDMRSLKFVPTRLVVAAGSKVRFTNSDVAPHTVTEVGGAGIDSGIIDPDGVFDLVVDKPLEYFCAVHPSMKARIALSG